jgi:D-alanyl-lipoteichoic acid acyltransferase DltB (MBOAT superfamily)
VLFNSLEFILFLLIVFGLYWFVPFKKLKYQNLFLLANSYFFYAWWDWRFLILMFSSSLVDYLIGLSIKGTQVPSKRKWWLALSVTVNVGLLCYFKYFNFFIDTFIAAFASVGIDLGGNTINIILPIGISFYTFQTLSYTIDVYRKEVYATKDVISYFAFVSFFPQLVAGPIERAKSLLPQFQRKRTFDYAFARDGALQILWGLFKKVAIADILGNQVEMIINTHEVHSSATLIYTCFLISMYVYADFSSYSDIAIGVGKLFGFRIMKNFNYPYFSTNFAEFFRRWHISLYSWFRDYVFIPIGGSRRKGWPLFRNIMFVFGLTGLWHGANSANYLITGVLHGFFLWLTVIWYQHKSKSTKQEKLGKLPTLVQFGNMILVVMMFAVPCIFFFSPDFPTAIGYNIQMFQGELLAIPLGLNLLLPISVLVIIEWRGKQHEHPLHFDHWPKMARWLVYYGMFFLILYLNREASPYIYFQF